MRRNIQLVVKLLQLLETHADEYGIYLYQLEGLWTEASPDPESPLSVSELMYLINRSSEAGLVSIGDGNLIQLTWAGHDYLDANTPIF